MHRPCIFLLAILMIVPSVHALTSPLDAANRGFNSFRNVGTAAALRMWGLQDAIQNEQNPSHAAFLELTRIEQTWGRRIRVELIKEQTLSHSTSRVYLALVFDSGVAYALVETYRSENLWKVSALKVSTDSEKILPRELLD